MKKGVLFGPVISVAMVGFYFFSFGCSNESEQEPVENGPPEASEDYDYDHPDGETGFSTEMPMGHCMVFAGYDSDFMEMYLCDPADNLKSGHVFQGTFKPHKIEFINGFCTTVIAGEPATLTGAVVIKPPNRKNITSPAKWTQYGMPDLSQHAIQPDWQCYCAPTSAANVITYFSDSYPELSPAAVFANDPDFNSEEEWLSNRLIAGNQSPFPQSKSFADRMTTSTDGGTTYLNMMLGVKSFIDENARNPSEWEIDLVMENEEAPDGKAFWDQLTLHCASGDGVLLCVIWGVPVPSSPEGSHSNEDSAKDEESEDLSESSTSTNQDADDEKGERGGASSSEDSEQTSESSSRSVEIVFPETDQEEPAIVSKAEIKDEPAVIVDDFNLIEKKGIWFLKGKDKPFTGKARRSYPSGKILMEIPYLNGKKHGIQTIWEESGAVMRKVQWKNDQRIR